MENFGIKLYERGYHDAWEASQGNNGIHVDLFVVAAVFHSNQEVIALLFVVPPSSLCC